MAGPYFRIALEQAPNYEGATNKVSTDVFWIVAEGITDDDGMEMLEEQDVVRGYLAQMPHMGVGAYKPVVTLDKVHPRPAELGVLLYMATGACTTTHGDGNAVKDPEAVAIPAGVYRHVFTFKTTEPPQSAQLDGATGDATYRKGSGFAAESLAFTFADSGFMTIDASLIGLMLADIADPSLTPVFSSEYPFRHGDISLTWLAGSATTTDFEFTIANPVEAITSLTTNSLYPDLLQFKNDALPAISGTIDKSCLDSDDVAALLAGTQFAATIRIRGREKIGATDTYPTLWVQMPGCQLTKLDRDPIKAERRREGKYEWAARYDSNTSKLATITLVNATAKYDTYPG